MPGLAPTRPPPRWGAATVLGVDYDGGVRNAARRVLERAGYAVLEARDAATALRLAEQDGPLHLVFTDLRLPDGDGRALAARVAELTGARILFTCAYAF